MSATKEIDVGKEMEKSSKTNSATKKKGKRFFKKPFNVEIELIDGCTSDFIPEYKTKGAAGCDLKAREKLILSPGDRCIVKTGIKIKFRNGFVGMVTPRSGLAINQGLTVLNAPGYIDSDYRDEIGVIVYNAGKEEITINEGDRVAQLSFLKVAKAKFNLVGELSADKVNDRKGGFGSSGVNDSEEESK